MLALRYPRVRLPSCLPCVRLASRSASANVYRPQEVERRWQALWEQQWREGREGKGGPSSGLSPGEKKHYTLSMFPYPSGRLHMGHVRVYTISDTIAHFHRMTGKKVLHPMGWDAFGLPAENAAIERGIDPAHWTTENISNMRGQMSSLGLHFDWDREVYTCSPDYYKWTQWLFLLLYKHGLAYRKKALVNWDPVDQTVLANEQVDGEGRSWRSGAMVEQKWLEQWFFKITDYAEPLLKGLDSLDWPAGVKAMQSNWIGRSDGAYFDFSLRHTPDYHPPSFPPTLPHYLPHLRVFTTRPDTMYGVSFIAISPEHELLRNSELFSKEVQDRVREMRENSMIEDPTTPPDSRTKDGLFLGLFAVHPFTGSGVPVYVANYVLSDYGTKAIMGVPAHDSRDLQFALEHDLPVVEVVAEDVLINSYQFSGLSVAEGSKAIVDSAHNQGFGGQMTQYKLRDWLISRQRYWGAPIPILYCDNCGIVPVPEDQLPVILPTDVEFKGHGPSPLMQATDWLKGNCGKPDCCARRETDTMDTFVDSSWYFLRYISPHDNTRPFSEDVRQWMPVDIYVGGIEHAILHLLYARFITHFLHDCGLLDHKEPFQRLLTQGMVLGKTYRQKSSGYYLRPEEREEMRIKGKEGEGEEVEVTWEKMSKSKYNGVDPEDVVQEYGADTVRLFMLFKAPPEADIQWDIEAIWGVHRWLQRVWVLCHEHIALCRETGSSGEGDSEKLEGEGARKMIASATNQAIQQVTVSLEHRHAFNVAVAELMILSNSLKERREMRGSREYHTALESLCLLLAPMAPHISSELWKGLQGARQTVDLPASQGDVLNQPWPQYDESLQQDSSTVQYVLQVDGYKRASFSLPVELTVSSEQLQRELVSRAMERGVIREEGEVQRVIIVTDRKLANIVTKRS